jgi:hypothetical protein
MSIVHISEEEAINDFRAVLNLIDEGTHIIIDRASGSVDVSSGPVRPLTFAEAIEKLPKESTGVMDEDFARDVRSFRQRHSEGFDSSKWD